MNVVPCKALAALLILFPTDQLLAQNKALRPITVDDSLRLEQLDGPSSISPDGEFLAYTVRRSPLSSKSFAEIIGKNSDIWLFSIRFNTARNLTNGASDGTESFNPVWSPDGQRLAILSTRGEAEGTKVWVWERGSNRLRMVGRHPVYSGPYLINTIYWLSNTDLIYLSRRREVYSYNVASPAAAWRYSQKVVQGREPTASVLESGTVHNSRFEKKFIVEDRHLADAIHCNVVSGTEKKVSERLYAFPYSSPDLSKLAIMSVSPGKPGSQLEVIGKDGVFELPPNEILKSVSWLSSYGTPLWSPNGKKLCFTTTDSVGDPEKVYILNLESKGLRELPLGELKPPMMKTQSIIPAKKFFNMKWVTDEQLVIYASRSGDMSLYSTFGNIKPGDSLDQKSRLDWWLIDESGRTKNLTSGMPASPVEIFIEEGKDSFVGLSGGQLWRIPISDNRSTTIFNDLTSIISLDAGGDYKYVDKLLATSQVANKVGYYLLNLKSNRFKPINKPKESAVLHAFSTANETAVFTAADRSGSYLWLSNFQDDASTKLVHETNTFLREINEGEMRPFEYRNGDGNTLVGWIMLPINYQSGKPYPLVTNVYAGRTLTRTKEPDPTGINNQFRADNPQYLATRGYAVLFPSMPLSRIGQAADPMLEHAKNVLPAVEKAIDMGIADPDRLAVLGCSYGGYTTYGLITQTNRFKAAIAMAGPTELISDWGIFQANERYGDHAHEQTIHAELMETGQGRMMNPPWRDYQRYVRNSPFSYVNRVNTPVLMIHGDLDHVSLQQVEIYFTGLYRQNKRARFVRYFGEAAHCYCSSPANNRHMMNEIYAWLDEFLNVSRDPKGNLVWDGERVKSRNGGPALKSEDFARFDEMILKQQK